MSIESAMYFWAVCDHPGCDERNPDRYSGYRAYPTRRILLEDMDPSGWRCLEQQPNIFLWVCPDCRNEYCHDCDVHIGPLAGKQDYLCLNCARL